MPRQNRIDDLRNDCILVSDNPREHRGVAVVPQSRGEILAQFILYVPLAQARFGKMTAAQFTQCARKTTHERPPTKQTFTDYTRRADGAFSSQATASRLAHRPPTSQ